MVCIYKIVSLKLVCGCSSVQTAIAFHTDIFVMEDGTVGMEKMRQVVQTIPVSICLSVDSIQHAYIQKMCVMGQMIVH